MPVFGRQDASIIYGLQYFDNETHFFSKTPFQYILIGRASLAEQVKVRIKVFPEQLTLFINTFVALKQCIIQ